MKLILDIATILGGVAGIWFLLQQAAANKARRRTERAIQYDTPVNTRTGTYYPKPQSSIQTNPTRTEAKHIQKRLHLGPLFAGIVGATSAGVGAFAWGFILFSLGDLAAFIAYFAIPLFLLFISRLSETSGYEDASQAIAFGSCFVMFWPGLLIMASIIFWLAGSQQELIKAATGLNVAIAGGIAGVILCGLVGYLLARPPSER